MNIPNAFTAGQTIPSIGFNQNFDEIESRYNGSIASVLSDTSTAGRLVVCNGSGVPQYVAMSGDATIASTGAVSLAANSVGANEIAANAVGASEMNGVPACQLTHGPVLSIPDTTETALAFNTEVVDTTNMHSTTTNNSRITIATAGIYLVTANVEWDGNTTGARRLTLRLGGSGPLATVRQGATADLAQHVSMIATLGAGDYIEAVVAQSSGGARNILPTVSSSPTFAAAFLSASTVS